MDVHQWHCNTKIKNTKIKNSTDGFRLSFVMYIRSDMPFCKKKRFINDISYKIKIK